MVTPSGERPDVWVDIEYYLPKYFKPKELSRLDTLISEKAKKHLGETPEMLADSEWGSHHRSEDIERLKESLKDLTQELIQKYSSDKKKLQHLAKNPFLESEFHTICFAITRLKMNEDYLEKTASPHPKMLQSIQTGSPRLYESYKRRFEGQQQEFPTPGKKMDQYEEDKELLRKILRDHFPPNMSSTLQGMYASYEHLNDIHKDLLDAKLVDLFEGGSEDPALIDLFFNPKLKAHYDGTHRCDSEAIEMYLAFPDQIQVLLRLLEIAEKLDVIHENYFATPLAFDDIDRLRSQIMAQLVQKKLSLPTATYKSLLESILS